MKALSVITLLFLLLGCAAQPREKNNQTNWWQYSVYELSEQLAAGNITSVALVDHYVARIQQYDHQGPTINSVISINPFAREDALMRDLERVQGKVRGPLHGIPVLIKDNIDTRELATTAGSLALIDNRTDRDAPIIARLRDAGMIVLGKTNLSEWANFRSEDSISGWSGVAGQTLNPHDLSRSPCGSSSGSGAAIAIGLAPIAIGTETNGSVICPASMNGIVGYKPTIGLLSRTHIVPISPSQDTAGPMAQSVKDAALLAYAMAGSDPKDNATAAADLRKEDLAKPFTQTLAGVRIGVMRSHQGQRPEIIALFDKALSSLAAAGAELVDITDFSVPDDFWDASYGVLLSEFEPSVNQYLASAPNIKQARSLDDLIKFNQQSTRELALFDQSIFIKAQQAPTLDSEVYAKNLALVQTSTREEGIDRLLAEHNVSLLVAPSNNPAFKIDTVFGDHGPWGWLGFGWAAAIAGYPHVSVPMGDIKQLPIGLSFISGQWQDWDVLNAAHVFQQNNETTFNPIAIDGTQWQIKPATSLPHNGSAPVKH
ncbi:amidase [Alteromonas facilis]|uniref:amidase n=1 Tax=Alteromonas facilis TaxID=2048004 RepID=UPI000C28B917|nr:amidase [Alteromonas facilis]